MLYYEPILLKLTALLVSAAPSLSFSALLRADPIETRPNIDFGTGTLILSVLYYEPILLKPRQSVITWLC